MKALVVVGTDTDVGKTIVSAVIVRALGAIYWKPVQSGLEDATDSDTVARLAECPVVPEAYRLQRPASPHLSAEAEGVTIDTANLDLPQVEGSLVVEGAGGLMVPLNRRELYIDLIAKWGLPVVLVARTQLGTINHSLLSLMALRDLGCSVAGIVFVGEAETEVEQTICQMGDVPHLGRLPRLDQLTPQAITQAARYLDIKTLKKAL